MSRSSTPSFAAELHTVSPRFAIFVILGLAVLLSMEHSIVPDPSLAPDAALLLYVLGIAALIIEAWLPLAGRWFALATLVALVHLGGAWLRVPGFLTLLAIPTALAAPMISLPAAVATAAGTTLLLLLGARHAAGPAEIVMALTATWAMVAIMVSVYRPVWQLAGWSWEHFQHAQGLLVEARARGAELRQALVDLAHANRQLALTNEKLSAARLAAEEAQRTKAAFLARVSHEFRTPLNMIIGLADLLTEPPYVYGPELPPALYEDLEIVTRNCEHLASMIDDVLDLSQMEAGRLALNKEHVNLAEVVHRAVDVVRPLLEKKHLRLEVNTPADLPEVYCDRTRIRQVILNLLSNAARFTEEGQITMQLVPQAQHLLISVMDTGPGIPPEDTARIFEPFYHSSRTPAQRHSGSGLGLSISKQFVELHDGRMWVESELGSGSTFYVQLPISPPPGPVARPERWLTEGWTWIERTTRADLPLGSPKRRVILCDETGELYDQFSRYSDEVEFVETAGLDRAVQESRCYPAHAVIVNAAATDDLWPLVETARAEIPDTPVIGCSLPPRAKQVLAAGAVGYLHKPVTRASLCGAIEALGRPVRRVLVVDDEADAVQLFARMLQAWDCGLEVLTASTGAEALAALRTSRPDLMLLDVVLPDIDGWQVLAARGQDEALSDIPVILVSAQDITERPPTSSVLLASMGDGLSVRKLVCCSRALTGLLLQPD
jgi:signal transduction histidine kinase/CheY-like chemotaxis protein